MKKAGVSDLRVRSDEGDPTKKIEIELARRKRKADAARAAALVGAPKDEASAIKYIQQEFTADKIIGRLIDQRIKELMPKVRKHMEADPEFPYDYDFKCPPIAYAPFTDPELGGFIKKAIITQITDFHTYGFTIAEEIGCRYGIYQIGPKQTSENYVVRWTSARGGAKSAMAGDSLPNLAEMSQPEIDEWFKSVRPRPTKQPVEKTTSIGE